ncbi:MAG: NAD(P)-dependent glycerol-3-phosphate dehydrogenase [Lentisphaeria bacterium]|nr:NAD(P)-dependent glycerol-3-phosphate dehydrogenase [Lentisphaeria bacterium]
MKISVFGDGAWGTALAMNLLSNGHKVTVWGAFPDYLEEMKARRENFRFLPGVTLPEELEFESDAEKAVRTCDIILLATPTQFLRGVLKKMNGSVAPGRLVINVAKGIEKDTFLLISQIVKEELGFVTFVDLSGPSHAEEVARKVPTAVVAASNCLEAAETVQQIFMNENFRVYTSTDVISVELGGALKNVMAIAAGIIDGMELGDNPKAAFMTRAIYEMGKLGELLGGSQSTFSGLSGIGDLIVTCTSGHSRNRHVGEELGRGKKLKEVLDSMGMVVAEGVPTALGAYTLARRVNATTPLIDSIYEILYHDLSAKTALRELMTRSAKAEN